ncbi:hypothetical protein FDZ14_33825 (plasmid) [Priestia megaterium]|uniref:DUF8096 domain-containing protein n=1 Tax=Priestia megaterium TaxID=1404 RepID=A0A6M6E966_PRIMG|nr:hypothetical protein FDZ14_33825 [Priestia megaterium]
MKIPYRFSEQEISFLQAQMRVTLNIRISGRCDNCNLAYFKSSVKGGVFLHECRQCCMKKSI